MKTVNDLMDKYVLYESDNDSVVIELNGSKAILYDTLEDAQKEWTCYPEEPMIVSELPPHQQKMIIEENTKTN
jgi:hypothetical protein